MATISPTTSLATFQTSHASSSKLRPHVRLSEVRNSKQRLGVLTVQGDGVWTYDLSTPRPTTSFTVPPSTLFAGPAVSFFPWISQTEREREKQRAEDGDEDMEVVEKPSRERVTAVVIGKGEGLKKSDEGRVIWVWNGEDAERQAIQIDGPPIQHLIHLERQSGLLAIQSLGQIKYIETDLNVREIRGPIAASKDQIVAADFVNIKGDWRLIMLSTTGRVVISKLEFQSCEMEVVHDGALFAGETELLRGEVDADGGVTALSSNHEIIGIDYKELRSTLSPPFPTLTSDPSQQLILPLPYHSRVALIPSQSTSSIALAIISKDSPAVLTTLPILLGTDNASVVSDIQILSRTSSFTWIIGFVVSHKHTQGDSGRSIVYTTEVALPERGIGLNMLLGSHERSSRYFRSSRSTPEVDDGADALIMSIEKALAESGGSVEARAAQAERLWTAQSGDTSLSEPQVKKLVNVIFNTAIPKSTIANGAADVSGAAAKRTGPYAKRIVADLLERRLLSDTMLPGGLISAGLLPCGDWDLIPRAIELLPTISSTGVISALIATLHPPPSSSTPPPSFMDLYAQVVRLPPPPPTWRVEMRQRVTAQDATVFLETLLSWAEEHVAAQASLATWDASASSSTASTTSVPPLPAILQHASLLLDSHIPLFLSHQPSHASLEKLQAAIAPLLEAQIDYRALQAPIDALLTLADRAARDKEESAARRDLLRPEDRKWRGGKPANGVVELRTEVIGKWRVEDFAF